MDDGTPVWACGEYEVIDPQKKTYRFVQDHPIEMCIGVLGYRKKDLPTMFDYSDDLEAFYKKKCGK